MVALTFPDGAVGNIPNGITGLDIAKGISPSLAKRTVAMGLDGVVTDLADPIERDAKNRVSHPRGQARLELIRHDAPMCWRRRCSRSGPERKSPSGR